MVSLIRPRTFAKVFWTVLQLVLTVEIAQASTLRNGLVAEYRMDGNLQDAVGTANGALVGTPSFVTSPYGGQALSVSPGNYGRVLSTNAFRPGSQSFSIGVDFQSLGGFNPPTTHIPLFVMQGGDFSEGLFVLLGFGAGDPSLIGTGVSSGQGAYQELKYDAPGSLFQQWHHAAVTVDRASSLLTLFLDGLQVNQTALTVGSIDPTQDFLFGAYDYGFARNGHARFVTGQSLLLDNLVIYDRSLSATEVASLAHIASSVPEPTIWVQLAVALIGLVAWKGGPILANVATCWS